MFDEWLGGYVLLLHQNDSSSIPIKDQFYMEFF